MSVKGEFCVRRKLSVSTWNLYVWNNLYVCIEIMIGRHRRYEEFGGGEMRTPNPEEKR